MEMTYLTMADISKSSPAKEHFVGLGNGLSKRVNIDAYFPLIGRKKDYSHGVKFRAKAIRFPFPYHQRISRLLSLCLFNLITPFIILAKILFRKKTDLIYSRHMPADVINLLISKAFSIDYCVEINGDVRVDRNIVKKNKFVTTFLALVQKFVIENSNFVVVPTSNLKRNILDEYKIDGNKIIYLENGIELEKFINSGVGHQLPKTLENKLIFGYAGVFSEWQGIHLIIESVSCLPRDIRSKIAFLLVGDGPEYSKIRTLVSKANLDDEVFFTGFLEQDDYISVVKQFDVCLAPYIKERNDYWGVSPIKIHSYMACAKPIITSDISGARELIQKANCGYLFEPDSSKSLASCILGAYEKRSGLILLGQNGFHSVSNNCTWDALSEKLYERIKK